MTLTTIPSRSQIERDHKAGRHSEFGHGQPDCPACERATKRARHHAERAHRHHLNDPKEAAWNMHVAAQQYSGDLSEDDLSEEPWY